MRYISLASYASLSKFRCGVAPIRLETGRFEGLLVERKLCQFFHVDNDMANVKQKWNFGHMQKV